MNRVGFATALALAALTPNAYAGEAVDALSKCLVDSATMDDRRALARWVFGSIAVHPDLQGLVSIDSGTRDQLDRSAAAVFERLVAQDCTAQSREAILSEDIEGYQSAFKTLGEIAMGGVVENEQVKAGLGRIAAHIDEKRVIKALLSK